MGNWCLHSTGTIEIDGINALNALWSVFFSTVSISRKVALLKENHPTFKMSTRDIQSLLTRMLILLGIDKFKHVVVSRYPGARTRLVIIAS